MAPWPTLSYGQIRGAAPRPTGPSFAVAEAAGGGFFSGAAKLTEGLAKIADKEQEARDTVAVSDAATRIAGDLDGYRRELDSDADYKSREAKFQTRAKEVYDRELAALSSPRARQAFHLRYNQLSGSIGLQVRHDARDAEIQDARVALDTNNDALLNKALFARSPQEAAAYLDQVKANVHDAVKTGVLPARMAAAELRRTSIKLQAGQASEMIRTNPAGAIAALRDPAQFPHLDANSRQQLLLQAQQRSESLGAQARSEVRAVLADYRAARSSLQPVSPEETLRVERQAKAAGFGRQFAEMKGFFDRVEGYTVGKTLPELRAGVNELEKSGTIADAGVARAVRAQLTAEERQAKAQLDAQYREFERYRSGNEAYPQLDQLLQRAEDYGGAPLRDSIAGRDAYWSRINRAAGEPASAVAGRLDMIENERRRAQDGKLTLEDLEERDALRKALDLKVRQAAEDPAAYARRYYPTIDESIRAADEAGDAVGARRARAALIDAQRREGIPEHRLAVLTKPQLDAAAAGMNSPDPQTRMATADRLRQSLGEDQFRYVRQQFAAADKKLPADIEVLATLPPGASVDRERLALAMRLSRDEAEKNIGRDNLKAIGTRVDSIGDDVQRTFRNTVSGQEYFASLKTVAERMAWLNANQGMDASMASRRAWNEVFYKHWDVSAGVRIPKRNDVPIADPTDVKRRFRETIDTLSRLPVDTEKPAGDQRPESARRAEQVARARRQGFWVTSADDRGAYLFDAPGRAVTVMGNPVYVPFVPAGRSIFEDIADPQALRPDGEGYMLPTPMPGGRP